ncbi:retron system putative HNH endonuclease [Desulfonatronospira sp.]|uniref:retron system putative HNH endonuclease n=1 Tax=Desulfonatronospira sp. TaxID=1962951 RepID=UPI0025BEBFE9|nr:retron system putative HNH endonuclease [Desulfonatronospira sp.]
MKLIIKKCEPEAFSAWKSLANPDWHPEYDNLSTDVKKILKQSLMEEQGWICCYCQQRITDAASHIEHFRPQSKFPKESLNYENMFCSCQKQMKKGEPLYCGNAKDDWYDEDYIISPLDPDCESHFMFTGNGLIMAAENDYAALETIRRLKLDITKLNDMRAKAIDPFLDESLSEYQMKKFVTGYLQKDEQGQFNEFWTMINYLFGDYSTV